MEQQRLNDLVFVKYNRALRRKFDERDKLDPISLKNIDESNEWLTGRMDGESDEDDELVHGDVDGLTWSNVASASGVGERSHRTRVNTAPPPGFGGNSQRNKSSSSSSRAQTVRTSTDAVPLQLIDEEEEFCPSDDTEEEDAEGYKSSDGEEDDGLLGFEVEDIDDY